MKASPVYFLEWHGLLQSQEADVVWQKPTAQGQARPGHLCVLGHVTDSLRISVSVKGRV